MNQANNKKRIGVDARFYGPIGKGLGRYTKEVVDRIVKYDEKNEYVIFLSEENYNEFQCGQNRVKKVLADVKWYTLKEQLLMPRLIKKEKIDLMHFPHFNVPLFCSTKFVVTIHDLILTKFPTQKATTLNPILYKFKNVSYRLVVRSALRKSAKVIAVSEFTKNDVIKTFGIPEDKIVVTYEGVSKKLANNENDPKKILKKYSIQEPFFLYVGNAYPHKNLDTLIDVFSGLKAKHQNINLVLVGKDDYFYERIKEESRDKAIFPGYIPDQDLVTIYKSALAYVFPSLYEGFGLPPLEAMSLGCPVVSSNKASMPEVLGDAAIYFDPETDDMKEKLEKIIFDKRLRDKLISRGYERIQRFSWEKCSRQTLEVYKDILI